MRYFVYSIAVIMLLLCSCESGSDSSKKESDVSLEHLPNTWVIRSYDTATQMGTGTHTTTTTLDGDFTVSLYDDLLFTLSGDGTMLAEGTFSIDMAQLKLELKEYSLLPEAQPEGIDETLVELITSHPLHIETLDENSFSLSLKYSDNVTITAYLAKTSAPAIAGSWLVTHIEGATPFTIDESSSITFADNGTFAAAIPGATSSATGTYTYTQRTHTLLAACNGDTLTCDAVCSEHSLRITPQEQHDYAIYLTR